MSTVKKLVMVVLFIILIVLLFGFVRTYQNIKNARDYVNFITDSTNESLAQVEQINIMLNDLEYDEEESDLVALKEEVGNLKQHYNAVEESRNDYKLPRGSEEVETGFDQYTSRLSSLIDSLDEVLSSVENFEDKEVFEEKLSDYVSESSELKSESEILEEKLNTFVQSYSKFDFNNFIDAIKFI
jgi:hypothetical protein